MWCHRSLGRRLHTTCQKPKEEIPFRKGQRNKSSVQERKSDGKGRRSSNYPIVDVYNDGSKVRYTFIQIAKKTHPKTLSTKNIFIQKHVHPKTLSSKTISSKREDNLIHDTFIQKRIHPMTLSSKNGFVQWHFHPMTLSSQIIFIQP